MSFWKQRNKRYLSHRAMKFYSPNRIFSLLDHPVGIVGCLRTQVKRYTEQFRSEHLHTKKSNYEACKQKLLGFGAHGNYLLIVSDRSFNHILPKISSNQTEILFESTYRGR
jgi:hypothetical protein